MEDEKPIRIAQVMGKWVGRWIRICSNELL